MKEHEKDIPSIEVLEGEVQKVQYRSRFLRTLRNTIFSLIVVAAAAVIVAMLILPIFQITGSSMSDTLEDGDIVVAVRGSGYETGDVIAFYYNNSILIKRVIAAPGQWVDIDSEGNVYVDNVLLDEPYVSERALGDCNITLPYQVPDGRVFVMGDHRATSVDSRNSTVGCISDDMVVGRLILRVWPLNKLSLLH